MPADTPEIEALSFEDALKRLETIVQRLESGDASLEEAIRLYGEGDRLRKQCEGRLASAQARIERIVAGADGRPAGTQPFDGE
jgi:exodeoxyribonuclease VII small subunit